MQNQNGTLLSTMKKLWKIAKYGQLFANSVLVIILIEMLIEVMIERRFNNFVTWQASNHSRAYCERISDSLDSIPRGKYFARPPDE